MTEDDVREVLDAGDIIEAAPDPVAVVDSSGRIMLVNTQLEILFGYDRAQIVGQPVEALIPERFRETHRRHRTGYGEHPTVRALGARSELYGRRRDGTEFPADISLGPLSPTKGETLIIATIRDITERVNLTHQAQTSLRTFETAFEAAPVGIAMVAFDDPVRRRLTNANDALCNLLGYSRDELLTKGFAELTYSEDSAVSDRSAQAAAQGEISRYGIEKRYIHKEGHPVWVWVHSAVVPALDGQPQQVLVHVADLTERKQAEAARTTEQRVLVLEGRERLAADLHDVIIQKLFATGMGLQAVQSGLVDHQVQTRIEESVAAIDEAIAELRSAIFRLDGPDDVESQD